MSDSIPEVIKMAQDSMAAKEGKAYAYHGNIVDLLEYIAEHDVHVDLISDQTSCHNVYDGGYCPKGITFEERTQMLAEDPAKFHGLVNETLKAHFAALKKLTAKGIYFFDYGNSFMKAVYDAGVKKFRKMALMKKMVSFGQAM